MKNIRRFDFTKKPHKPYKLLIGLAKNIISRPDLKKRNAIISKIGMEEYEGKPYLLLVTHSSMVDFNLMLMATDPYPVNNVMTLEGFKTYSEPLMRGLGVIGKRKYVPDINLLRNIKYCLHELKSIFVLFPEARYSLDGCTSFLPDTLGKLTKMMKVPVIMLKIHGNFITCPQWNKINKKSKVTAEMYPLISASELNSLSESEIQNKIEKHFKYDDFKWQLDNKIIIDHPERAKGLHSLLYKCPNCMSEGNTDSSGSLLFCRSCGKSWNMDVYGRLAATDGVTEFSHIPDWSNWERECVRKEIQEGSYYFEDTVKIETLPNSLKFYKQGYGKLIQTPEGTKIICNLYGKPFELFKTALSLESMHIEYDYLRKGDCVDISVPDDSFWCYLSKRDAITKLSFATEEIYLLAKQKLNEEKRTEILK